MAVLYHPSLDPSRVYYGTDTRACELLAGAALAMVWPSRRLHGGDRGRRAARARRARHRSVCSASVCWSGRPASSRRSSTRGGFVLLAICDRRSSSRRSPTRPAGSGVVLGWAPLRWIGVRSYGIYLWHFPIIVLTTPSGVHQTDLLRDALQVAATFGVAALSWRYVEQPVRHGALGRLWGRLRSGEWRPQAIRGAAGRWRWPPSRCSRSPPSGWPEWAPPPPGRRSPRRAAAA